MVKYIAFAIIYYLYLLNIYMENYNLLFNQDYLISKIKQVLDFAIKNIWKINSNFENLDESYVGNVKWSDKIFAETCILLFLISRNPKLKSNFISEIEILCNLISPLCRTSYYKSEILKFPRLLMPYGFGHIMLNKLGYYDEEFDLIVSNAVESKKYNTSERIPYREMDLRWMLSQYDSNLLIDMEDVIKVSILNTNASVIDMSRNDEYAFTHALFYSTDFGESFLPKSLSQSKINKVLNGGLAKNILKEVLDILGEFLICSNLTRNTDSFYYLEGLKYLFNIWDRLGFLPSPTFSVEEYSNLSSKESTAYIFKNIYHTYYVGGILCCTLLSKTNSQPKKVKHNNV